MTRPRFSIGTRWAVRYTVATLALVAFLTLILYARISSSILDGAVGELRRRTSAISEMIARHPGDLRVLTEFIETEIASSSVELQLAIELYDDDQRLLLRRDILAPFVDEIPPWVGSRREAHFYREDRGTDYPFFVMVGRHETGFSRVAIDGRPFLEEIAEIRRIFVLATLGTVILTGLLGIWLSRRTLAPIVAITNTAKRVRSVTDGESIPVRGNGDELDELAGTLNEMLGKIRDSADRLRRFAAQAAHELRTPLTVARTRIEVTLEGEGDEQKYADALKSVLEDLEVLESGIEAVLDIARSEAGLRREQMTEIAMTELLESVVEFFQPLAVERGLEIRTELVPSLAVLGDRLWLHRLFSNLVDNAIKFSDAGGTISVTLDASGDHVHASVRDTGAGVSSEDQDRIFDRFYRGDGERTPGQGLGLALSMEIARAHGGTLEYVVPEGAGSLFRVTLPRAPAPRAG